MSDSYFQQQFSHPVGLKQSFNRLIKVFRGIQDFAPVGRGYNVSKFADVRDKTAALTSSWEKSLVSI